MRKIPFALAVFLVVAVMFPPFSFAGEEERQGPRESVFIFPSAVLIVEESAFEGTAVKTVVFPDGFREIGKNAFRGAEKLADVFAPASTKRIGKNAFPENNGFTIHGVEGSYAEKWAEKHRIPFVVDDVWRARIETRNYLGFQGDAADRIVVTINPDKSIFSHARGEDDCRSRRPQDRPELYPIDYRFP